MVLNALKMTSCLYVKEHFYELNVHSIDWPAGAAKRGSKKTENAWLPIWRTVGRNHYQKSTAGLISICCLLRSKSGRVFTLQSGALA